MRSQCQNNLKQLGLAIHNHHSALGRLPTGGQGTDFHVVPPATTFDLHSLFTVLLPYLEEASAYQQFDVQYAYNATPGNLAAAQQSIPSYLCPSNSCASRWSISKALDSPIMERPIMSTSIRIPD